MQYSDEMSALAEQKRRRQGMLDQLPRCVTCISNVNMMSRVSSCPQDVIREFFSCKLVIIWKHVLSMNRSQTSPRASWLVPYISMSLIRLHVHACNK